MVRKIYFFFRIPGNLLCVDQIYNCAVGVSLKKKQNVHCCSSKESDKLSIDELNFHISDVACHYIQFWSRKQFLEFFTVFVAGDHFSLIFYETFHNEFQKIIFNLIFVECSSISFFFNSKDSHIRDKVLFTLLDDDFIISPVYPERI